MADKKNRMPYFDSEKDFIRHYKNIADKRQQIEEIKNYREWLARLDESKAALIKAIADNLYTERTQRFFLELLQNADDNKYNDGVEPTIEFIYRGGTELIIRNNEIGFSAEDVYSITTAALSTKYLSDNSAYIGEKGIGFKSVFAVAESVEIHSSGYHFTLYNGEYIIPHWIEDNYPQIRQTEIVLHLKKDMHIWKNIMDNLREMSGQTLGMILFLHQLQRIKIILAEEETHSIKLRDHGKYRWLYLDNSMQARYYLHRYTEKVSSVEIKARYPRLYQDKAIKSLQREIIFAVPDPEVVDLKSFKGSYFAFLQTRMSTGLKMHIQIDAETTTNREQYTLMSDSAWNTKIMTHLEQQIYKLFLALRDESCFRDRLPEFFPAPGKSEINANEDAQHLLHNIHQGIKQQPIFLNNHGEFKKSRELVLISAEEADIFYQDHKYEKYIKELLPAKSGQQCGGAFIDRDWNSKYHHILSSYGVYRTVAVDHFTLLKAGPPKTARLGDYLSVVQFNKQLFSLLQELRNYDNLGEDTQEMVQEARVFPALTPGKTGYRRAWVSASEKKELRWQDISSKSARVPSSKYLYIDAEFTYRPGGRITNREAIASNNAAYREFLSRVGIRQHSVLNSLIDTHVLPLTKGKGIKPEVAEKHWIAIYDEYWIKQSMLERERKEVVLEFLDLLPSCQLPVMLADRAGTHTTTKASKCFVGDRFHADTTELFREYLGSGAAIVHFAGFSAKAKVDWQDWRQFLSDKCGVHTEPYLVDKTLMDDNVINTSISNISVRDEELAKLNPFMADIARAVISHHQFKEDYGNFEIHYRKEGEHQKLDADSHYILYNNRDSDFLARSIATKLWMQLKPEININVSWKYKASCTLKVKNKYFDAYVVPHLRLRDNTGKLVSHGTKTFFYCKANTEILGSLGVYIKDSDYGGNSAFLVAWGVKREVDAYDVLRLHDIFLEKVESGAANLDEYLQYIKMSCRYLQGLSEDREIVQKSLHLWNPELAEKQPAHLWISSAYRNGFPEDLISDVRKLMVDRDNYSPDELLDVIFGREHDLGAGLYKLISDLGAKATGQESDLEKDIEDRIAEHGISLMGRKVFIRDELPVVWLINLGFHKEETDTAGIWVIAPETATEAFRKGLDVFGWPTSDDYAKTVEFENQRIIHPTDMHKLEKMYCDSDEHLNQENRIVNKTWLEIIQRIKSNAIIICQGLYFGVNGTMLQTQYALHDKLYLNESIYPLFSLLYSLGGAMKPEITKKLFDAFTIEEEEAEEISQPGYQTNENRKNGGANPSSGSDHAAKEESGGSGKQRDPDSKNKEYRTNPQDRNEDAKPYAFYRTGIYSSKPSSIRQDTKRETGKKGEQIAAQAEIDSGRKVEYQPENNPGYDLISHSESEDRYIEVKTVNGSWSHVLLTAREFAASQEYKERYWVYVVELLGDDMHRLTRIQNPFAKVTHYSLDDGWRVVENPGWYSHNDDYEDLYES